MWEKRFLIKKDAHSYLKENKIYPLFLDDCISKESDFSYLYNWDDDFRKYFRIDIKRVEQLADFYDDITLFLKNLKLNDIFDSVENTLIEITTKIKQNLSKNNSLIIINISPLEGAILWTVYKELWLKNIVFSFNRKMWVNYEEKTFEASLLLLLYANSEFLQNKTKNLAQKIITRNLDIDYSKIYMIIDENNSNSNYDHTKIDNYLKTQIWFNTPKNVYRLDKYPDVEFLNIKWIDNVIVFDNDRDLWKFIEYYKDQIKKSNSKINFKQESYILNNVKNIWYFEDYLIQENRKYILYKKDIEKTALNKYKIEKKHIEWNYLAQNKIQNNNLFDKKYKQNKEEMKWYLVYFIATPILFILFLLNSWWSNHSSWWVGWGTSSSWSSWWYSWSTWVSSSSSTSSSSSSVWSFWWGWFSKSSSS